MLPDSRNNIYCAIFTQQHSRLLILTAYMPQHSHHSAFKAALTLQHWCPKSWCSWFLWRGLVLKRGVLGGDSGVEGMLCMYISHWQKVVCDSRVKSRVGVEFWAKRHPTWAKEKPHQGKWYAKWAKVLWSRGKKVLSFQ